MGYTNKYTIKGAEGRKLLSLQFAAIAEDCKRVVKASGIPVASEYDRPTDPACFEPDGICFIGIGESESCETFYLDWKPQTAHVFCKTNRLPYDLCVKACLIVFKHYLNDCVEISSDGDDEADCWIAARELCGKVLGYGQCFISDGQIGLEKVNR